MTTSSVLTIIDFLTIKSLCILTGRNPLSRKKLRNGQLLSWGRFHAPSLLLLTPHTLNGLLGRG
jgi:hypothetical protein